MAPLRNATVLLAAALLLSLPLFGQTVSYTLALTDNTTWCATGNCLTALPATPGTLTEIKAGYDGTTYALDAALPTRCRRLRSGLRFPAACRLLVATRSLTSRWAASQKCWLSRARHCQITTSTY